MIIDNTKNHDRIIKLINDYWNKENLKNVVDIRFVCERDKTVNETIIRGIRINNIFVSCNQLESITGKKIVHEMLKCNCSECLKLKEVFKNFDSFGEIHSMNGIKTEACKCEGGNHGK